MKTFIIYLLTSFMMLIVSCKQEQPTQPNYDKYAIQLDTNWVEVFDIDTLHLCFGSSYWNLKGMVNHQLVLKSEEEYKTIFDEAVKISSKDFKWQNCDTIYKPTGIVFQKKILILYTQTSTPAFWNRKIFYNSKEDEYLYLLEIKLKSPYGYPEYDVLESYNETLAMPRYSDKTKIKFDTIMTYNK